MRTISAIRNLFRRTGGSTFKACPRETASRKDKVSHRHSSRAAFLILQSAGTAQPSKKQQEPSFKNAWISSSGTIASEAIWRHNWILWEFRGRHRRSWISNFMDLQNRI